MRPKFGINSYTYPPKAPSSATDGDYCAIFNGACTTRMCLGFKSLFQLWYRGGGGGANDASKRHGTDAKARSSGSRFRVFFFDCSDE